MEYWPEGVRGRIRLDVVHHKSHGHGDGPGVVHVVEVDARYREIAAACGDDSNENDAWVAANPYEAIGRRWEFPQKPLAALVLCVPAVPAVPAAVPVAVRTPILSTAGVYYDRPNAMTAVIRMVEYNGLEECVDEEDSIEVGDELLAPHRLGKTDDMELDIAETPAYPKHWSTAG